MKLHKLYRRTREKICSCCPEVVLQGPRVATIIGELAATRARERTQSLRWRGPERNQRQAGKGTEADEKSPMRLGHNGG